MDAAARLFAEKGYESTSVRDILDAVNGAPGMFYYYLQVEAGRLRGRHGGLHLGAHGPQVRSHGGRGPAVRRKESPLCAVS